jgi:hypothetical protein
MMETLLLNLIIGIMTPSLSNFLFSLVAGAVVLIAIYGGALFVSQQDKVRRR